jgi:hypothetical protein
MEKENHEGLSLLEWIIALVLIISVWLVFGSQLTTLLGGLVEYFNVTPTPLLHYLLQHIHFILLALVLGIFIRWVVKRPLKVFVTDSSTFRWPLFFFSYGVWTVAIALFMLILSPSPTPPLRASQVASSLWQ